jgi:glycosyltransferase involved in cell wall biosynthesis
MAAPQVSVIIAAYGRPDALLLAIRSALAQSLADLEVIVVCDACSRSYEAVRSAIDDPRVRTIMLARNTGEQSGPNNKGALHARGRYVAYLNQDDLWYLDHLAALVDHAECHHADVAFSLSVVIPSGWKLTDHGRFVEVLGLGPPRYDPVEHLAPASSWLVKTDSLLKLGGWRSGSELVTEPSQDILLRAWRAGMTLVVSAAA